MKFICNQKDFSETIAVASRFVSSRPSQPVLGNLLIEANFSGAIAVSGFDLSMSLKTECKGTVLAEGAITLPCKLLSDIVTRLPDGDITFELSEDDSLVTLTSASGKYQIRGLAASEYPTLPVVDSEAIALSPTIIKSALSRVLYAASTDDTKQVLTGVNIQQTETAIAFAATDGHRLAITNITGEYGNTVSITLPSRALGELERITKKMPDESADLQLRLDDTTALLQIDNSTTLTCRVLAGAYPACRQLIPVQFERTAILQTSRLVAAIGRVSCLADQKNNLIKISFSDESATISTTALDIGQASESVPVDFMGTAIVLAFNLKYLAEALKNLQSEEVKFQFNEANQPVIVSPVDESSTHLIMPVQIRE